MDFLKPIIILIFKISNFAISFFNWKLIEIDCNLKTIYQQKNIELFHQNHNWIVKARIKINIGRIDREKD